MYIPKEVGGMSFLHHKSIDASKDYFELFFIGLRQVFFI